MATSVGTITGRNGEVTVDNSLVARVTLWDVNPTLATSTEWGDSDTAGYTARKAGRKDATFNVQGKFETTEAVFSKIYIDSFADVVLWMSSTLYWAFPRALCTDFSLSVDIDAEEVIGFESSWGADGVFYYPGQTGAPAEVLVSDSSQSDSD